MGSPGSLTCRKKAAGFVQGIPLPEANEGTVTIHPKGTDPNATYFFENDETGETRTIAGKDLIQAGFTIVLPTRSGAIWFYRSVHSEHH